MKRRSFLASVLAGLSIPFLGKAAEVKSKTVGGGKKRELVYSMMVRPKGFADCKLNQDPNSRMEPWDVLSPEGDMRVPLCKIKGTKEEIRQHLLQQVDELLESLDNCEGEFSPPIDDGWRLWSNAKPCGNVETHSQFTPVSDL